MIKKFVIVIAVFFTLKANAQTGSTLKISNPVNQERKDELVVLSRDFIEKKLGNLTSDMRIGITQKNGSPLFLQFDDLDKDGKWDELAFIYSFKAKEKAKFTISKESVAFIKPMFRAHVRQMRKNADNTFGQNLQKDSVPSGQPNTDFSKVKLPNVLTEGPAWENDKVGFRIYMDVRNTKDIWGKTTSKMMMDQIGVDPKNSYHHKSDWGMDILAVGKSLGAGSLAMLVPIKGQKDSLVRLGGKNMGPIFYEQLVDGPIRAVFTMHYPKWQILPGVKPVDLTEKISIWGGNYFYQSEVKASDIPDGARLVTGIVNLKAEQADIIKIAKSKALYTYDKQSENGDYLGMAIAPGKGVRSVISETPKTGTNDILNTYTLIMPVKDRKPVNFRFYVGWESTDQKFGTELGFKNFLHQQVNFFWHPLKVK